ncbi:MAG: hypothetical protein QXY16_00880 [Nanopusillaceae archaeon]
MPAKGPNKTVGIYAFKRSKIPAIKKSKREIFLFLYFFKEA